MSKYARGPESCTPQTVDGLDAKTIRLLGRQLTRFTPTRAQKLPVEYMGPFCTIDGLIFYVNDDDLRSPMPGLTWMINTDNGLNIFRDSWPGGVGWIKPGPWITVLKALSRELELEAERRRVSAETKEVARDETFVLKTAEWAAAHARK